VSQAGTVAWLATRELWMTFRLLLLLIVSVGAGAVVGLLPAPLPQTMPRLAAGLAIAITVAAAVAAWSLAEERVSGRAGWLVTRSVARSTYLIGWYVALLLVPLIGIATGIGLGWLAVPTGSTAVAPGEYLAVAAAVLAALAAAVGAGLLFGALLRPRVAMLAVIVVCAAFAGAAIGLPQAAPWVPGSGLVLLSRVSGAEPVTADALRAAGIGLALAAVVLAGARLALERTDL
jgi:hypothetical protein